MAMERSFERVWKKLSDVPLLINGDDVGFLIPKRGYPLWKELTDCAGLKFSLGKNYTSKQFLILNSQLHEVRRQVDFFGGSSLRMWRVPHFQIGLLYGCTRDQAVDSEKSLYTEDPFLGSARSLAQMARDMIQNFEEHKDFLMSQFFRIHGQMLKEKTPVGMSWFMPRHLGGLGFPVTRDLKGSVSELQLKIAAFLATRTADDPALRDLLIPDLPSFLQHYLSTEGEIGGKLGISTREGNYSDLIQLKKSDSGMPFIHAYTSLGLDSKLSSKEIERKVKYAWKQLRQEGLATSLKPMCLSKALYHDRILIRQKAKWV
jgi:hypothetical protein